MQIWNIGSSYIGRISCKGKSSTDFGIAFFIWLYCVVASEWLIMREAKNTVKSADSTEKIGGMNKMQDDKKITLFENTPVPKAVAQLTIPTIISSLVMVIYNLADTYFVGMVNDPVQNAAVTLAAPVLLAFNAVNNLCGVYLFLCTDICKAEQHVCLSAAAEILSA